MSVFGLSDSDLEKLARVLFQEEERIMPEGRTWEDQDNSDRSYYRCCVKAVLCAYRQLRGQA